MDLAQLRNIILHAGGEVGNSSNIEKEVKRTQKLYPNEISIQDRNLGGTRVVSISLLLCKWLPQEVELFFIRLFEASGLEGIRIDDNST